MAGLRKVRVIFAPVLYSVDEYESLFFILKTESVPAVKVLDPAIPTPAKDEKSSSKSALKPGQLSLVTQLLQTTANLGRALSDFFGLLVKLSISTAHRQRRAPHSTANPGPSRQARLVSEQLCNLLTRMLTWKGPPQVSMPRLRYDFQRSCSAPLSERKSMNDTKRIAGLASTRDLFSISSYCTAHNCS